MDRNKAHRGHALRIAVGIMMLVLLLAGVSSATTITVDDSGGADYTMIQDAINAASSGDTIIVQSGTYRENVNVNKQLILKGVDTGSGKPVVDAKKYGSAILLTADSIILEGFVETNSSSGLFAGIEIISNYNTIKNNIADKNNFGIYLHGSSSNIFLDNVVKSNEYCGIYLDSSNNNTLIGNTVNSNRFEGIFIIGNYNNLTFNTLYSNTIAIRVIGNKNSLSYNTAYNNNDGIQISGTENMLSYNIANSNYESGIIISYSINGIITKNTASNNRWGIFMAGAADPSSGSNHGNNVITDNIAKDNHGVDMYILAGLDTECNNDVSNNIGSGDRPIKYFNSSVTLQNEVFSELILCNADNSNINNVTIDGSITNNNNGLLLIRTDNSYLQKIKSLNNWEGMRLSSSNGNTVVNSIFSNNSYGIELSGYNNKRDSVNNIIRDNIIGSNTVYGINIGFAYDNIFINNTIFNNHEGIYFYSGDGNTFTENKIVGSNSNGIYFNEMKGINTFYDNFFDNIDNFFFNPSYIVLSNIWNTPMMSGNNIIGGPYLGGNFWANPSGTGFSQTCADTNKDGVCDLPYVLNANNTDYLPLTSIVLPAIRLINGTVKDNSTGNGLAGVTVSANSTLSTTSDVTGFYSFAVTEGTYNLVSIIDDIRYYTNTTMVSTEGQSAVWQDIDMIRKPTGNIIGSVTS